jgi:hypothetical protein
MDGYGNRILTTRSPEEKDYHSLRKQDVIVVVLKEKERSGR